MLKYKTMSTRDTAEIDVQNSHTADYVHLGTRSTQLVGIVHHAALPSHEVSVAEVAYHVSNDDLAVTFDRVQSRELMPEYEQAENRAAILIGESALMAAIRYIPEEVILMLDKSPKMIAYMAKYVTTLRTSESIEEWYEKMGFNSVPSWRKDAITERAGYWQLAGLGHPALSADAFAEASELARQKTIVPWQGDIANSRDMSRLGRVLRAYRASVTLLNLTNVLCCESRFRFAHEAADRLAHLPVIPGAPILTTTGTSRPPDKDFPITHPAGLFLGLEDLREHGGITDPRSPNAGPAITRVVRA